MGPTKAVVKDNALYEAANGKLIKDGFASPKDIQDYVKRHYIVLPVTDNQGRPWLLDDKPIYCLRGTQYETVTHEKIQLSRCPDCGGMGIRDEEATVDSDCIQCTACGHEFDARLEMMET
jgi:predicted RNA-binding Zn-ribbon protein involved in translation (DUF1610 family)